VLYYIRKDFFPSKEYQFENIRIALPNDTNTVAFNKGITIPTTTPAVVQEENKKEDNDEIMVDVDEQTGTVFLYPKVMDDYYQPNDEQKAN